MSVTMTSNSGVFDSAQGLLAIQIPVILPFLLVATGLRDCFIAQGPLPRYEIHFVLVKSLW